MPHSKNGLGLISGFGLDLGFFFAEFTCFPHACFGVLWILRFPSHRHKYVQYCLHVQASLKKISVISMRFAWFSNGNKMKMYIIYCTIFLDALLNLCNLMFAPMCLIVFLFILFKCLFYFLFRLHVG